MAARCTMRSGRPAMRRSASPGAAKSDTRIFVAKGAAAGGSAATSSCKMTLAIGTPPSPLSATNRASSLRPIMPAAPVISTCIRFAPALTRFLQATPATRRGPLRLHEGRPIARYRFRQIFRDRPDAPEAACVLVRDEPIGPGRPSLGQDADEVAEAPGDEVMHDAEAHARAQRFELGDGARTFELGRSARE